jgi:uncharacterized protein (TIGR02217 family)
MSAFHNASFPLRLARGAVGGPERRTEIFELGDGREARNSVYAGSRRRWEIGSAIRSLDELALVTAFFEARRGRLHGFRFRDPADFKSCTPSGSPTPFDQKLGTGDGLNRTFQLIKVYSDPANSYKRVITKPVATSVRIAIGGVELAPGGFVLDPSTGTVTLTSPAASGVEVRAGFTFDTPARFDSDRLDVALDAFDAGRVVSLSLIEVTS